MMIFESGEANCAEALKGHVRKSCEINGCTVPEMNQHYISRTKISSICNSETFHQFRGKNKSSLCDNEVKEGHYRYSDKNGKHLKYLKTQFSKNDLIELNSILEVRFCI